LRLSVGISWLDGYGALQVGGEYLLDGFSVPVAVTSELRVGQDGDLRGIAGLVWPLLQRWNGRPIEEASRMPVHLATASELEGVTGKYFTTGRAAEPSRLAQDDAAAKRLWEMSERLVFADQ